MHFTGRRRLDLYSNTLDDLRSNRHEKSKQHRWRDKEGDTKIDQDTTRAVRRVRV